MKRSLAHLPKRKKDELKYVVATIREVVPATEMIILFGSYARGDWQEEVYREGHTIYEYKSDFDILVVTEDKKVVKDDLLWRKVENRVNANLDATPVTLIRHDIKDLNRKIRNRYYFFTDVKKEGIFLYNSRKYKLDRARKFSPEERQRVADEDFKIWFKKAREFFDDFSSNFRKRRNNQAAFMLHQATEHTYAAVLLTFTGHKPKLHDLERLDLHFHRGCHQRIARRGAASCREVRGFNF